MSARSQSKDALAEGQVWKTPVVDIEIVALGEGLIRYKVRPQFAPGKVGDQISPIAAMHAYLRANRARLVRPSSGK